MLLCFIAKEIKPLNKRTTVAEYLRNGLIYFFVHPQTSNLLSNAFNEMLNRSLRSMLVQIVFRYGCCTKNILSFRFEEDQILSQWNNLIEDW